MNASVLIVDDSLTVRMDLAEAFDAAGFRPRPCSTLAEARDALARERIALVVLDVLLPDGDGLDLLRELRTHGSLAPIPVLLLSTEAEVKDRVLGLLTGADDYVGKPYDVGYIVARARELVQSQTPPSQRGTSTVLAIDDSATFHEELRDTASLLGPMRILAVDDSPTYLNELASILRSEGYDVVLARSGQAAIDMLAVQPVDCILLDLVMPGLDGHETCRRIKASAVVRDIPLIMLTAVEDTAAMLDGFSTGADDFISKSSEVEVLKARVRAQLRRRHFEEEHRREREEHRRVREELLQKELEASEQRAARVVAETKAALVEQLKRKNGELEAFSYSVSHDLRAPLRSIDGFSKALLDDATELSEPARGYLKRIRAAAQRMAELIDDLLELSRVSRAQLVRSEVNVSELARGIVEDLQRADPDRRVDVRIHPDAFAQADGRLLRVVLENLLGNAWKFTSKSEAPEIALGVSSDREGAVYFVRDNGAGFDPTYAKRLFTPFQRLHSEADFPGTGIGLATVSRILERHGGRVWAEGAVGKGATVFFTLPQQAPEIG